MTSAARKEKEAWFNNGLLRVTQKKLDFSFFYFFDDEVEKCMSALKMDYEMMDFYGGFSHGFNDRLGVAVIYDNRSYFGGALDGFIQGFHDLLGVGQNHRDDFAKDRSIIQRFDKNTGVMVEEISAHDLNNSGISALISYNLFHGTRLWPSINIYGVTRFGLENSRIINQDNKLETGFGLGLAKRWTNSIYSYGVLGYTFYNNDNSSDTLGNSLRLKKEQKNAMAALAWQVTPDCSLLAQYLYSSSVVKEIWGYCLGHIVFLDRFVLK